MKDLIEAEGDDVSQKEEVVGDHMGAIPTQNPPAEENPSDAKASVNQEDATDPLTGYKPLTFHDPM